MERNGRAMVYGIVVCIATGMLPSAGYAQNVSPTSQKTTTIDSSAVSRLARAAIVKFCPSLLADTTDPGALFVIVSADGNLLNATHGNLEAADALKAKYEDYDNKVASMEITVIPAGALLHRALEVVVTTFKP